MVFNIVLKFMNSYYLIFFYFVLFGAQFLEFSTSFYVLIEFEILNISYMQGQII